MDAAIVNRFLRYLRRQGLDEQSIEHYRRYVGSWLGWCAAQGVDGPPTADDAADWIGDLLRSRTPATVANYVSGVRTFYHWAAAEGICPANPFVPVRVRRPEQMPRYVTPEQYQVMRSVCDLTHRRGWQELIVLSLLWDTGMRVSELAGLRVADLHLVECTATIMGKRRRERIVWYTEGTAKLLRGWLAYHHDGSEWVLPGRHGPMDRHSIAEIVRRVGQRAGLGSGIHPHMFRHGLGTFLSRRGVDVRLVQEILGHRSITSTQLYTHVAAPDVEAAYRGAMEGRHRQAEVEAPAI